jgi:stalled ribosome rescue protein Dom34
MEHYHAVVWLDHRDARVFHTTTEDASERDVHADDGSEHQASGHRDRGKSGKRPPVDKDYFEGIIKALGGAKEILVMGPADAKTEFVKYIESHHKDIKDRIIGVEAADHMSNYQVVEHARRFFKKEDRMRPLLDASTSS